MSLCLGAPETAMHLCIQCPYAAQVWQLIHSWTNHLVPLPRTDVDLQEWWHRSLQEVTKERKRAIAAVMTHAGICGINGPISSRPNQGRNRFETKSMWSTFNSIVSMIESFHFEICELNRFLCNHHDVTLNSLYLSYMIWQHSCR